MTYILIFITAIVSILCFNNRQLASRLSLDPYMVVHRHQWYRVITHGFVHADYTHLLVNMFVLWSFGSAIERIFKTQEFAGMISSGYLTYALLYFGALVVSSLLDVYKYRNNPHYSSIGASGAVSAVVFTSIFFNPLGMIYFFAVIPIPGILFGVLYLFYENYAARRQGDNINHYAHIVGAVYGFIFPLLISFSLINVFLNGLKF